MSPTGIYQRKVEHGLHISEAKRGKHNYWMPTGEKSALWRGSKASYSPLHKRVYKLKGKANSCDEIGCTKISKRFEWANLTGNYEDINDYRSMCKSCHAKFDNAKFNLPHIKHD